MGIFDFLKIGSKSKEKINDALARGGVIVDVRSPAEFQSGHVKGSMNIPLGDLESRAGKLKKMNKPIVLCCASGMRSGSGVGVLQKQGIECYNGGGWRSLV